MPRAPKVSVVVPVYDPGRHIDGCIASLLDQSLAPDGYEVIFVDDGSTDGTPARLDALAAEHAHVRVEHIPNSGWPGRPRNVGLELARGDHVLFVDNDDRVGPEALQRLHATAERHGADVVLGKVVGEGRHIPRAPFLANRAHVALDWPPLLELLTPHKLFRTAFLRKHGIRFPDEPRRLEDHLFVVHAFLHARVISVLADYPCYRWVARADDSSASARPFDIRGYYDSVREVLDLVAAHVEPGPLRDRLSAHWYRGKMLGRVGGAWFAARGPRRRRAFFREIRALALERYGPEVDAWLPFNLRLRSRLLRDGRLGLLELLAQIEAGLAARATLEARDGDVLVVSGTLTGSRSAFVREDGRVRWNAPPRLRGLDLDLDVTGELARARVELVLQAADGVEYVLPADDEPALEDVPSRPGIVRAVPRARARLDPAVAAAGAPLPPGEWRLRAVVAAAGFTAGAPVLDEEGAPVVVTVAEGRLSRPGLR